MALFTLPRTRDLVVLTAYWVGYAVGWSLEMIHNYALSRFFAGDPVCFYRTYLTYPFIPNHTWLLLLIVFMAWIGYRVS